MPWMCSISGCKSNYKSEKGDKNVTTFRLPKNKDLKRQWLRNIPTDLSLKKNPRICIKHFENKFITKIDKVLVKNELQEFERKYPKLQTDAVPTIFPECPSEDPDFTSSVDAWEETGGNRIHRRHTVKIQCCVSDCVRKEPETHLFNFPQSLMLVNMWKTVLKLFKFQDVTGFYVCEQHFDERDFVPGTKNLKKMAIPSFQRNDVKQRQVPALQKRTALCNCECTCEKRQTVPAPPTTRSEPGPLPVPSTEAAVPNPNNADNGLQNAPGSKQYVINRLSKFEQTEIKENSIVVCDKNARIVINSDDASLRANLVKLVRKVLIQNAPTQNVDENLTPPSKTGEEAAIIILEDDEPEKDGKAPVSKGTTKQNLPTAPIDEEIIKIEVEEDCSDPASNESQDSKALLTKALEEVSLDATARLQAKFKELADSFGTRCPFCGYDVNYQQDVVFHVRRIHHGLFLHRPISDDDIYKELIKKIEILQKEEQEFPVHYLNCNFKMFCRYCEETFSNIDALVGHVKAVHETSCGPLPLSEAQLMSGMRNCKFCNRILTKAEDHSAHVPRCIFNPASKGYQETQVCEFCGKIGTRTQIKSHYATVHSSTGKHLVCERCGRTLSNRASYRNHMLRHENKRAIRCPKEGCNKLFNTAACLRTHKIFHASPDRWKYVCDQCGKRFPVRLSLMTHEDSHSTVRVNCPSCDKTFKGKYALQVHISKYHATMKEERAVVPKENDGEEAGESDGGKAKRKRGAKRRRDSDSADEDYGEGVEVVYLEDLEPGTERRSEDSRGLQGSIDLDETED